MFNQRLVFSLHNRCCLMVLCLLCGSRSSKQIPVSTNVHMLRLFTHTSSYRRQLTRTFHWGNVRISSVVSVELTVFMGIKHFSELEASLHPAVLVKLVEKCPFPKQKHLTSNTVEVLARRHSSFHMRCSEYGSQTCLYCMYVTCTKCLPFMAKIC